MEKINDMSKNLLKAVYANFTEKSKALVCIIKPIELSETVGISIENFYLCLWYLESKKLIREKTIFKQNLTENDEVEIVFTADGVDLIENMI